MELGVHTVVRTAGIGVNADVGVDAGVGVDADVDAYVKRGYVNTSRKWC